MDRLSATGGSLSEGCRRISPFPYEVEADTTSLTGPSRPLGFHSLRAWHTVLLPLFDSTEDHKNAMSKRPNAKLISGLMV